MTDAEILAAVEAGLVAQGNGQTVIEPRVHLEPDPAFRGHFNVLRGYVAPLDMAGVKIVGDYVDNYLHGLPSEFGILNLFDPRTGMPRAILDATVITDMRTGAVTAIGAKHLAQEGLAASSAISVRAAPPIGTCGCSTICSISTRSACIRAGRKAATHSPRSCRPISASRCEADRRLARAASKAPISSSRRRACREPQPLLKTEWIKPGALVVPYGTMSAVELSLTDIMEQDRRRRLGPVQERQVRRAARPCRDRPAERGDAACRARPDRGRPCKPGRESDDETILFWHRGLSLSDIALGTAMLTKAQRHRHRPEAALRVSAVVLTGAGIGVEDVAAVARAGAHGRDRAGRRGAVAKGARGARPRRRLRPARSTG